MSKRMFSLTLMVLVSAVLFAGGTQESGAPQPKTTAAGPIEIYWWYAMGGQLGEKLDQIAVGFNASQSRYKVNPVMKGNYTEVMTAGIAAFRAGQQPHIIQVFEVGTASMMAAKGAVKPVYEVMQEAGERFDPKDYLATVTGYYSTPDGRMLSMPFNSSMPIMYYNADAFRKAGLDPDKPPKTWPEVEQACRKLVASGAVQYGFTTGWQSWVQIENFSAWHNLPIGTRANGFEGLDTEFRINSPAHVKHIQQLADWQKDKIFVYGGRRSDPDVKFTSGETGFLFNSSAASAGVKTAARFEFRTSMLPYWPDLAKAPQNSIIGGATLWVLQGHKPEEYKGVAAFLSYLSRPEVQADWHQFTGYLPITYAAYELSRKQGFYQNNPGTGTAILQMTLNQPTPNSKGLRFGSFVQIRDVFNEELEAIWSGSKTARQGLDDAARRGNQMLREFEAANR